MNTRVILENSFEVGWAGRPKSMDGHASFELVKVFGDRIYSIAKHITQNDDAAENVLIKSFLEVCSDLDGCHADEEVWLRLVTIAVRETFSKLYNRGQGHPLLDRVVDSYEDLVVREFSLWGDDYQQRHSQEWITCVLRRGLRSLDPLCRTVFVLRDIENISVEHIATVVNRSSAVVELCLLRARLQLREMLAPHMRRQP